MQTRSSTSVLIWREPALVSTVEFLPAQNESPTEFDATPRANTLRGQMRHFCSVGRLRGQRIAEAVALPFAKGDAHL